MNEFNFDETEMSTSINQLRKKKSEQDNETNSYTNIRMKLYNDINSPVNTNSYPILKQDNSNILYNKNKYINNKNKHINNKNKHINNKNKCINNKNNKNNYFNIISVSLIFFIVNNYYLNNYLVLIKFSYYTIVFIKLILFLLIYYLYKYLIN
jgi:hypothetical protein